jgi:hypothetical protein
VAEEVVDKPGYASCAEPYFNTKLGMPAVRIPWKKEFWHRPVFRKTVESEEGPKKSDRPQTTHMFDNNSAKLGKAAGLPDRLQSYVYRRGNLEILDSKSLPLRSDSLLTWDRKLPSVDSGPGGAPPTQ